MKNKATNNSDIKTFNRILIRNIIRRTGSIARYELAQETGLTPPTITAIVNELINSGVVMEVGFGASSGGRRPVMLELNPKAAYIFAVSLQRDEASTALFDISGNVLNQHKWFLDTSQADEVVEAIGNSFDWLVDSTSIAKESVLFCGVASPGLINTYRGVIKRSSNLKWEDVALAAMLSRRLYGIPVEVQNISNAAAFAEKEFGVARGYHNFVYLNLSVGIGAGIIMDGELYVGTKGYAGEIGHIPVLPDGGPQCPCGQFGCLEAICGIPAIIERIKNEVPAGALERHNINKARLTIADLLLPPVLERDEIQSILKESGRWIGLIVANLVNILNPELIILGGELPKVGDCFTEVVVDELNKRVLKPFVGSVKVIPSAMKEDPPMMGAYALAMDRLFSIEKW